MKILAVDVGTGTQDIFLYDSRLSIENGFKLVLPSPTMMVHQRIQQATRRGDHILLTGVIMGGGPSQWAAERHVRAGFHVYATPDAAQTFNDELDKVAGMGIQVIAEEEARRLPDSVQRIELKDFDFAAIAETFLRFGVDLHDLSALAVAVFDHGAAPPGVSDRQFRFDYLDERIRSRNSLASFAYLASDIPPIMTRLQAVARSARGVDVPVMVMDTAPAAILGALFDPVVAARQRKIVVNVGNFHTLAFRLGPAGIEGVFEHHTGETDRPRLETFIRALADGSLQHADIFDDMGHGALVYDKSPLPFESDSWQIAVSGPRREMFMNSQTAQPLVPYFSVPFGDMMIAGCFGMLAAAADLIPDLSAPIHASLYGKGSAGTAPWDA